MTPQEAKKMLEAKLKCLIAETSGTNHDCNMRLCDGCPLNYEQGNMGEQKQALDMAIKALEQQPCEDCISREEVRRVLGNEVFELMKIHITNSEDNPKADAMAHGVNWSLNTLMELPSVKPQRPSGEWIRVKPEEEGGFPVWKCSKCGCEIYSESKQDRKKFHAFCGACGAKMKEGGNDDE